MQVTSTTYKTQTIKIVALHCPPRHILKQEDYKNLLQSLEENS